MPKELICVAPDQLEWREYTEPDLTGKQVRVQSEFTAVKHGTEMSFFKGYGNARGNVDGELGIFNRDRPAWPYPIGVGNMTVGRVVELGPEANELTVGDRVVFYGGFRPTHSPEENYCRKLPPELSWKSAVCLDPADFAFGAVRDGHVRLGDAVAVLGLGAIGLMVVQLARLSGALLVIAVDPLANRRAVAEQLGADLVLDPTACDPGREIRLATGKQGVDVAIDYSGCHRALQTALRGVAFGGTVVAGAYPPAYEAGLDFGAEPHFNAPNLIFSRSCSSPNRDHPRWTLQRICEACFRLFVEGRISGEPIVGPVVPFDQIITEYPKIASDPGSNVKLAAAY